MTIISICKNNESADLRGNRCAQPITGGALGERREPEKVRNDGGKTRKGRSSKVRMNTSWDIPGGNETRTNSYAHTGQLSGSSAYSIPSENSPCQE